MKIFKYFSRPGATNWFTSLIYKIRTHLSLITLLLIFAYVCYYNFKNEDWNNPIRLIKDDVQFYYIYASSSVVYNDIKFGRVYSKLPGYAKKDLWLPVDEKTGRSYSKMSMGLSFIYAPFTALAHYVFVPLTGDDPNGYSPPYKIGLLISAMVFLLLGLWHLRKILLEYFSETITAITLLIISLGTNLSWYITSEATMSHVYSFALVIVMYRLVQKWIREPSTGVTILLGLIFGLIVLIRPTNIMFLVLFFATGKIYERIQFLFRNYGKIILMMAMFLLVWVPQFAFWEYVSGNWFLYSYGKESFFWNNPQITSSLFSYRKGWLTYTPLMFLAFAGLLILWKQHRTVFWQVFTVLILLIYINSSWWCWWFGGSYGNRAYIDGYGIFALSIGALLSYAASKRNLIINISGTILLSAFIFLNLFQTWQSQQGLIHYVSNTRQSYWLNFMRTKPHPEYENSLVMPDHALGMVGIYYPKTELTGGEKKQFSSSLIAKRKYLIRYYLGKAREEKSLRKLSMKMNMEYSRDSLYQTWALNKYLQMKKRYQ